jgi:hypothetical protein
LRMAAPACRRPVSEYESSTLCMRGAVCAMHGAS